MDKEQFEKGVEERSAVLGAEYVKKTLEEADEFARPFQEKMTEWCWGFAWGDDTLDRRTRSMLNLTMIAALNRMHEWELHLKGALTNGVSLKEIRACIHIIAVYAGVPAGVECMRIAKRVFAEQGLDTSSLD